MNELAWTANSNIFLAATGGDGSGYVDVLSLLDSDLTLAPSAPGNVNPLSSAASNSSATSTSVTELAVLDRVCAHVHNCVNIKVDAGFRRLAVGSMDHYVSFWDLEDMVCLHTTALE